MKLHLILRNFLLGTICYSLVACQPQSTASVRSLPLPQDPLVEVYFNHNQAQGANYQEPYRHIQRQGDNLEQLIVEAINSANASVDVAVQELNLPKIAQALAQRHRAGIQVRVILENTYNRSKSQLTTSQIAQLDRRSRLRYEEFIALADRNQDGKVSKEELNQGDAILILRQADVPLLDDTADGSKGSGLMHHKFLIIDNQVVITGSANFTHSGMHGDFALPKSRGNTNHLLKISDPRLANIFTQEFNLMWGDGPGGNLDSKFGLQKPRRASQQVTLGKTTVEVQFSPTSQKQPWRDSSNGFIGKTLQSTTKSVDLALFVFSEQRLANILEHRHHQGLSIRALIDPNFAFRHYSEGLDMLGVALTQKCREEANNQPWQNPISTVGVPQLPVGDKLHHKFAILDNATVITGSHNWSAAANYNNDETVLVLHNPTVAAHFSREFSQLYRHAVLGVPIKVQRKMRAQKRECL